MTPQAADRNTGHGHVWARPDGMKARCGGPKICAACAVDYANYHNKPLDPAQFLKDQARAQGNAMTTPHDGPAPFKRPFRTLHYAPARLDGWSVRDTDEQIVAYSLTETIAQWLCDTLNAASPTPPADREAFEAAHRLKLIKEYVEQWRGSQNNAENCMALVASALLTGSAGPTFPHAAQHQTTSGWVLVPREPTPVMLMDGQERIDMPFDEQGNALNVDHTAADVYRIMLASAPSAPSQTTERSELTEEERRIIEWTKAPTCNWSDSAIRDAFYKLRGIISRLTAPPLSRIEKKDAEQ